MDSVYVQLLDILNRFEYSEDPEVYTLYIKNMIPIPNDITDDCINKIKLLATVTEIDELLNIVKFIINEQTNNSFMRYMSNMISTTIVMALKYRYAIEENYFPYLTKYDECYKFLIENGVKEDIDNVLLFKTRKLFGKPSVECLKAKNDSKIVSKLGIINTTVETGILVLPQVYAYLYKSKEIYQTNTERERISNEVYQQAFKLFDDSTLYIDVYDRALNHYRVWRLGRDIQSPDKFEVEFLQQF